MGKDKFGKQKMIIVMNNEDGSKSFYRVLKSYEDTKDSPCGAGIYVETAFDEQVSGSNPRIPVERKDQ